VPETVAPATASAARNLLLLIIELHSLCRTRRRSGAADALTWRPRRRFTVTLFR
jgi:hypothetical protein